MFSGDSQEGVHPPAEVVYPPSLPGAEEGSERKEGEIPCEKSVQGVPCPDCVHSGTQSVTAPTGSNEQVNK